MYKFRISFNDTRDCEIIFATGKLCAENYAHRNYENVRDVRYIGTDPKWI